MTRHTPRAAAKAITMLFMSALVLSAKRLRRRSTLAAEVAALEADEADRDEMVAVAELMESLRGPG